MRATKNDTREHVSGWDDDDHTHEEEESPQHMLQSTCAISFSACHVGEGVGRRDRRATMRKSAESTRTRAQRIEGVIKAPWCRSLSRGSSHTQRQHDPRDKVELYGDRFLSSALLSVPCATHSVGNSGPTNAGTHTPQTLGFDGVIHATETQGLEGERESSGQETGGSVRTNRSEKNADLN